MIKKHLLVFIAIILGNTLIGQEIDSKDKLLDLLAKETCECVNGKDLDFSKSGQNKLELEYGLCVMESYSRNKTASDKYLEISFDDEKSLENLGVEVALKMMSHCSDFMLKLAGDYAADEFEEAKDDLITIGEIVAVTENQFNIVELKDTDDRLQKFLWLEFFEGENLLNQLSKLKKKRVKVTSIKKEMYDPKINDYRNFKVIKKISIL